MNSYDEFRNEGYVIFKKAFNQNEVTQMRDIAFTLFKNKKQDETQTSRDRSLYSKTFFKTPELLNFLFHQRISQKIKEVLGDDFITFAQFSLTSNIHDPTWHTDSQSQGPVEYIFDNSYNIAKCGIYLQEDCDLYGGQIEIIPKSHKPSMLGYKSLFTRNKMYGKLSKIQSLAYNIRNKFLKKKRLKLKPGDVLLFHSHLWHRASQPNWSKLKKIHTYGIENPPKDKHKFMIQWEVSKNNSLARVYATHQFLRAVNSNNDLFIESNNSNPNDLDPTTEKIIKENKCNLKFYQDLKLNIGSNILNNNDGSPIVFLNK